MKIYRWWKFKLFTAIVEGNRMFAISIFNKCVSFHWVGVLKWKRKLIHLLRFLQVWPIYFKVWSRDCDCCETTEVYKFWSFWQANKAIEASYLDAEGPVRWSRISKKEYVEHKSTFRDRVLEAYENTYSV